MYKPLRAVRYKTVSIRVFASYPGVAASIRTCFIVGRGSAQTGRTSAPGAGFLANLCREWEAAAQPARDAGIRVVHLRNANVLDARRGFLAPLLPLFRLGLPDLSAFL